jgi:uncharacterized membrane protein (UPF0136 family)
MIVVVVFVVYALLLFIEAVMTYGRTGGKPSFIAGLLSGVAALSAAGLVLVNNVSLGVSVGMGVMLAMMGVFGSRYMRTRAFFPAGVMMTLSLVTLGVLFRLMK